MALTCYHDRCENFRSFRSGLMTLAAYVGGGGLGYLVFSGIRTVSNVMILAGAIPACILAS